MPSKGISRMGSREVAGIGMASVAHQTAIRPAMPTVSQAVSESPAGGVVIRQSSRISGPRNRPMYAARAAPVLCESVIREFPWFANPLRRVQEGKGKRRRAVYQHFVSRRINSDDLYLPPT